MRHRRWGAVLWTCVAVVLVGPRGSGQCKGLGHCTFRRWMCMGCQHSLRGQCAKAWPLWIILGSRPAGQRLVGGMGQHKDVEGSLPCGAETVWAISNSCAVVRSEGRRFEPGTVAQQGGGKRAPLATDKGNRQQKRGAMDIPKDCKTLSNLS